MSVLAILMLALGIGANTAVFSIVNPLLLRPLPLTEADRLVWIANTENRGMSGATYRVDWYEELKRQSASFEDIGAYFAFSGLFSRTLTGRGDPARLAVADVAPGFFRMLGVEPAAGRQFLDDEHRGPVMKAAILAHGFWQRRFAGDPSIVGQAITINNTAVTVVGIMPESFDFSSIFTPGTGADLFLPADLNQMRSWGNTLALVGRLRKGVHIDQARAEYAAVLPRLQQSRPEWGVAGAALTDLRSHVSGPVRRSLVVLWGAVGFVLLIACANVTNLLLARASARRREFAVRGALGAGRGRLFRQVLTEGVILSTTGALLGLPIAYGLTVWLTRSELMSIPLLHYARLDVAALSLTALVACLSGVAGAVVPALRLSEESPQNALSEQSRGAADSAAQAWMRRALVIAEIALAAVLLVGAGLLGRSFTELLSVNLGFEPTRAVAARVDLPARLRRPQQAALVREILGRVITTPGVEAAGVTDALPLDTNRNRGIGVPGRTYGPGEQPAAFVYVVSPGYLAAMGIAVTAGRDFVHDDPMVESNPVVINEALARVLYPGDDPIGRSAVSIGQRLTIVGVVADVRQARLDESPVNQMYLDLSRGGGIGSELIVRSGMTAAALAPTLRRLLAAVDSRVLVSEVRPVEALVERSVSPQRFLVQLTGGFSVFALALASLGIYGVVSYHVGQRTAEIGVRMALGATGGEVRRRILVETLTLAISGIAIGGVLALLLSGVIRALLFSTSANDPVVFGITGLILLTVATIAGLIPAERASRLDPARVLRAL